MVAKSNKPVGMAGHDLLLRLAGRIPDAVLAQARRTLAEGKVAEAIAPIADLLTATPILLTAQEIAAIRDLSGKADALPGAQAAAADSSPLSFGFSAYDQFGDVERDEIDEALVAAAEGEADLVPAIWRTWRYVVRDDMSRAAQDRAAHDRAAQDRAAQDRAAQDVEEQAEVAGQQVLRATLLPEGLVSDSVSPHRVYVVQVEDRTKIDKVAARLLAVVPDSANSSVEIIALDEEPPPYQQTALAASLLLWTKYSEPEFRIARVFDFADPVSGPGFAPDHPVVEDFARRESLLHYLRNGHPVLTTTSTMDDVIDLAAGSVVPSSFRTDGEFIWTDTVAYYLERHRLAPDAQLTEHVEGQIARGVITPDTDDETAMRAADYVLNPPLAETSTAVWFPDGPE